MSVAGLCVALASSAAAAGVTLDPCFSDNMVLQCDRQARISGVAEAGAVVTVEFKGQTKTATADAGGAWTLTLGPLPADAEAAILMASSIAPAGETSTVKIGNVLVGEVWICSGQSNMRMTVQKGPGGLGNGVMNADAEVAAAQHAEIRLVSGRTGGWQVCSPETVKAFSAAGYFFGRELHRHLGVPIGLVEGSMGATAAESWVPHQAYPQDEVAAAVRKTKELAPRGDLDRKDFAEYARQVQEARKAGTPLPQRPSPRLTAAEAKSLEYARVVANAGSCFDVFFAKPAFPALSVRGVIWYQGESNRARADRYADLMRLLIRSWREAWRDEDLAFVLMQLLNYEKEPGTFPPLRAAQQEVADTVPDVFMAVGIDIGEPGDIHPRNKQEVGRRLALCALKGVYKADVVASGPVVREAAFEAGTVRLSFDTGGGAERLVFTAGPVSGFELAGPEGQFFPADAVLQEQEVVLTSAAVRDARSVRYAWSDNPPVTLSNTAGLPAAPFQRSKQ
jgi:sialate O-acetylesterase